MKVAIDSREKARAIVKIVKHFNDNGIMNFVNKLPVGDYMDFDNPKISIDRKQNLNEIASNCCQDHARFVAELVRANDINIKLIILCEHGGDIKSLDDVRNWVNPRLKVSPLAVSGERLYKILLAMSKKYNVEFMFCDKKNTGSEIIRLLSMEGK